MHNATPSAPPIDTAFLLSYSRDCQKQREFDEEFFRNQEVDKFVNENADKYYQEIVRAVTSDSFHSHLLTSASQKKEAHTISSIVIDQSKGVTRIIASRIAEKLSYMLNINQEIVRKIENIDGRMEWSDNSDMSVRNVLCIQECGSIDLVIDFRVQLSQELPNFPKTDEPPTRKNKKCNIL